MGTIRTYKTHKGQVQTNAGDGASSPQVRATASHIGTVDSAMEKRLARSERKKAWRAQVARRLRRLVLDEMGWKIAEFAREMNKVTGESEDTIKACFKERGGQRLDAFTLHEISEFLEIDITYFLRDNVDLEDALVPFGRGSGFFAHREVERLKAAMGEGASSKKRRA